MSLWLPRLSLLLSRPASTFAALALAASPLSAPAATCPDFGPATALGTVTEPAIAEASGLAASRHDANVVWTHNDSGGAAELYALAQNGTLLATYALTGATNVDWEDLAIGPGPVPAVPYLYVADIGDNNAVRSSITVYRVAEPTPLGSGGSPLPLAGAVALEFEYPDGAHDAETLLSDPLTGDLYVVTKTFIVGAASGVYRAAFPQSESVTTLEWVASHVFPGGLLVSATTGGDISPSGDEIVVRTYAEAFLWRRTGASSVAAAFDWPPCEIPLAVEPQGESLAFLADGSAYVTLSEQTNQPLFAVARTASVPALVPAGWALLAAALFGSAHVALPRSGTRGP